MRLVFRPIFDYRINLIVQSRFSTNEIMMYPLIPRVFRGARQIKLQAIYVGLGLFVCLVIGCSDKPAADLAASPLPQVAVITLKTQSVADEPEFIGQTQSFRPVEIRSQVSGIIKQIFFTEGRNIKKGDRLYQIDPIPFRAAYQRGQANVAQAKVRLKQAQQDLARVRPLLEKKAVSKKNIDDAEAEVQAAKATLDAAQNELTKAKFDLDNTLIYSPVNGRIGRSQFYEGRLIEAQESLLTAIAQLDPMYVNVNVPESYLLKRRRELVEQKVASPELFQLRGEMTFSDGTVYPEEGVLDFADIRLRPETGTLQGRFRFSNPDGKGEPSVRNFLSGQFVKVRVKGYIRHNAILVPQRAVHQGPKGSFVFIINEEDKVELRSVLASSWRGKEWLIESGLSAGERVVVEGFFRILPGVKVNAVAYSLIENESASRHD